MPRTKKPTQPAERDHRGMMLTPGNWPHWPFLPIKRWLNHTLEVAVLYDSFEDTKVAVYHGANLWGGIPKDQKPKFIEVDDLLKEGWVVD